MRRTALSLRPLGAWFPSCRSITYKGSAGAIHVQASDKGYVAWGTPRKDANGKNYVNVPNECVIP
jgi:hypothetical protein